MKPIHEEFVKRVTVVSSRLDYSVLRVVWARRRKACVLRLLVDVPVMDKAALVSWLRSYTEAGRNRLPIEEAIRKQVLARALGEGRER
jgi:hypothetical protein